MEFKDFSNLTEKDFKQLIEEAEPCSMCGDKEDLEIGVITEGEGFGRLILFCGLCQWEPLDDMEDEEIIINDNF